MTSFTRISCADAHTLIASTEANIIDIRDQDSFNKGHIVDAEHMDNHSIAAFVNDTDHDQPLIVCCYHGNSSQSAAAYMAEKGFEEVYSLDGGYEQWLASFPEDCEKEI